MLQCCLCNTNKASTATPGRLPLGSSGGHTAVGVDHDHAIQYDRCGIIATADITDHEVALIAAARISPEYRYSLGDED